MSIESSQLIVILGPTASGKTGYSIKLAKEIGNAEIVNADSRQLYRYLDIGTAKITKEEMEGVPHHLIDVLDPDEEVSVGWYQNEATRIISEIKERGNVPILVGGSMLYISSITDGLSMAPTASKELRNILINEYNKDEGVSLHNRLKEIDPEAAERIHRNNKPRLVRAVEIYELTKTSRSDTFEESELRPREGQVNEDMKIIGIKVPREELVERINRRTSEMIKNGWVEEVRGLLEKGYKYKDPGMKSCGYREIINAINSDIAVETPCGASLIETIAAKTRQYARRQVCWWRNDRRISWINYGKVACHPKSKRPARP